MGEQQKKKREAVMGRDRREEAVGNGRELGKGNSP